MQLPIASLIAGAGSIEPPVNVDARTLETIVSILYRRRQLAIAVTYR